MNDAYDIADEVLGPVGRMLSASKSGYYNRYPDNIVVFNANVCTAEGKIWFGDIDCTREVDKLRTLAERLGTKVYVLREMDGRFGNEDSPNLDKAVFAVPS